MTSRSQGSDFWRYTWDYENRLSQASTRKQNVRYRYDALGRRVQRFVPGGRENTKFIYDGEDVVADDDGGTLTKYQNGPGIDNKLRVQTGSDVKYFLSDHLGSTNGLTDSTGAVTASTTYDSFGNATNASFPTRYQFTGREYDSFTGLQYYRARFYDANLGRFISEDPIGFGGGDINLYGYVKSNAVNKIDPLGLIDPIVYQDPGIYGNHRLSDDELDNVQLGLAAGGMAPVIGEACDLADGFISLLRGDYTGAGLSAASMVPILGWGSGLTKIGNKLDNLRIRKYLKGRPSYSPGQVEAVWDAAKNADGRVLDPDTGVELFWDKTKPRNGQWDMGHQEDIPYRKYHKQYLNGEISLEELKRIHRDPSNYRPQSVRSNRGWRRRR